MTAPDPARRPPAVAGLLANSSALFGSRIVVAGLGWAGTILVVRQLDAAAFGRFAFVFSLIGLLSFATDLSSSRIIVRALAEPGAARAELAGAYLVLRASLGLLTYLMAVGFVVLGGYPSDVVLATVVAGLTLVVGAAGGALDSVFQAEVRMGHVALGDVIGQLAQLGLTVAVALTRPSLLLFVVPALLFDLVAVGWKTRHVRRLVVPSLSVQPRLWASVLRQAAPLATGTALFALSLQVPVVLLSKLDDFEAVARYGIAVKFVTLAAFLPSALAAPLLPLLVRSWPQDLATFRETVRRALLVLTVIGGAIIVAFVPVAPDLVAFLYGGDYRGSGTAASVAVTASCLTFGTQVGIVVLITVGRHRAYIALGLLGLATTVAGTLLLVPALSFEGAALASAVSAGAVFLALLALARRSPRLGGLPYAAAGTVLACVGVGVLTGRLAAGFVPWPAAMVLAMVAYTGLVELSRATGPCGLRSLLLEPAGR